MNNLVAFPYFGGKLKLLDFIIPLIPKDTEHFVDVFGGSAAVILNAGPFPLETYNDIDKDVVNFFKVLRDEEDELIRAIKLTPYSRTEHTLAVYSKGGSDLERARKFFILARQTVGALSGKAAGGWGYRVNFSSSIANLWANAPDGLPEIANRLRRIQIECVTYENLLDRYDSDKTTFYCDPPYVHGARGGICFKNEMSDADHRDLHKKLDGRKGRVIVSGYESDLYDDLYRDWWKVDGPDKAVTGKPSVHGKVKPRKREVAWANFQPKRGRLF